MTKRGMHICHKCGHPVYYYEEKQFDINCYYCGMLEEKKAKYEELIALLVEEFKKIEHPKYGALPSELAEVAVEVISKQLKGE